MTRVLLLEGDAATAAATKKMLTEQNFLCDTTDLVGPRVRNLGCSSRESANHQFRSRQALPGRDVRML